ncbi:MAG: CDP-diacylglycerol--glycerol-3-phosphate 3-phosphatidyltransferase [Firmicutes bacterium]|nr:CDP-diacylglycerol--glycerol-3-phosphate 3-phosphatidyltransferase [Bacillota bacterium]
MKWNLPNKLTMIRVLLVPVYCVIYLTSWIPNPWKDLLALVVFVAASLTDLYDGKIARSTNQVTDFGKFMDPLADKLLVGSAVICFTQTGLLPAWAAVILIGREFVISGFRLVAASKGVVIAADIWGKIKTTVQMIMIVSLLIPWDFFGILAVLRWILIIASVLLTIISVVNYIRNNLDVLKEKENETES